MGLTKWGESLELRAEVEIAAAADWIWRVLTEIERYPEWNPMVVEAHGKLRLGAKIRVVQSYPGGRETRMRRKVVCLKPGRELRWAASLAPIGLLTAEQFFLLHETDSATTRVTVGENLRGLLLRQDTARSLQAARGFALFNQALKARAEGTQRR